jgi:hypothetical protein
MPCTHIRSTRSSVSNGRLSSRLDKRDAVIEGVRREIEIKVGLGRQLAKAKSEIERVRHIPWGLSHDDWRSAPTGFN